MQGSRLDHHSLPFLAWPRGTW